MCPVLPRKLSIFLHQIHNYFSSMAKATSILHRFLILVVSILSTILQSTAALLITIYLLFVNFGLVDHLQRLFHSRRLMPHKAILIARHQGHIPKMPKHILLGQPKHKGLQDILGVSHHELPDAIALLPVVEVPQPGLNDFGGGVEVTEVGAREGDVAVEVGPETLQMA